MTDKPALDRLIAAIEAGDDDFAHSDDWIYAWSEFHPEPNYAVSNGTALRIVSLRAYDDDMNAALALFSDLLPGWCVSDLSQDGTRAGNPWGCVLEDWDLAAAEHREKRRASSHYDHASPARALLLATLKAHHHQVEAP